MSRNMVAAERVAAGAAFLDQNWPQWWVEIDEDNLNLASACNCVLGQLGVDYNKSAAAFDVDLDAVEMQQVERDQPEGFTFVLDYVFPHLGLSAEDADRLGFDSDDYLSYDDLEAEWRRVITDRRLGTII